jgi:hypothetical protein
MEDGEYISKSYFDVFTSEIEIIVEEIESFIANLSVLEDEIYDAKYYYVNYLTAIKEALLETETNNLVYKWSKVDEAWMQIKTPFQIGHPLEYYEDKYRKAVAPEWDLRIQNIVFESDVEPNIMSMYETLFKEFDKEKFYSSYVFSKSNINRVQFYLTSPVLYYSSSFT